MVPLSRAGAPRAGGGEDHEWRRQAPSRTHGSLAGAPRPPVRSHARPRPRVRRHGGEGREDGAARGLDPVRRCASVFRLDADLSVLDPANFLERRFWTITQIAGL